MITRRRALVAGWVLAASAAAQEPAEAARPHLALARSTARWLSSREVRTEHGLSWKVGEPFGPDEQQVALYHGTPGIVLFLLEAHHATGEAAFLERATAGADHLIASSTADSHGLYTGTCGVAFALWETWRRTGEARFADAARQQLAQVHAAAEPAGDGVSWGPVTDVISGSAGIGLFLLYAAREMDDAPSLDLARRAGLWLLEQAAPERGGRRWAMSKGNPRNYPNFSHGTAGVAYFLLQLHRATGEKAFLDAALDGVRYLDAVAVDGLVFHSQPGSEELFYLGWCHGPPGTTRLHEALLEVTGDDRWRQRIGAALDALVASGIPESRPAGFWNNAGQCCGTAGVIEFLLELGTEPEHRALLDLLVDDLRARATTDASGTRWVLAEHRVRPELVGAQTGYMQGAAGIGLCLLHLDGAQVGRDPAIVLPDAPDRSWERACRRAARGLIDSASFRQRYPSAHASARYRRSLRLRHPLLDRYLAGQRLYFAELEIRADAAPARECYLTVLRAADKAGATHERGRLDVLEMLQAEDVRARTAAEAIDVHALARLLDELAGGFSQPASPLADGALERRFGPALREPAPLPLPLVPRAVETGSRRYAVTCLAEDDDSNMPVALSYRLLAFDRESGRLLGVDTRRGETFAHDAFDEQAQLRAFDAFVAKLAGEKD